MLLNANAQPVVVLAPFGLRPKATLSRRALPLTTELAQRGWPIHVLAPPDLWPADAGLITSINGVTVEHGPLQRGPGPLRMLKAVRWMYRRTLELQPQLVHVFKPKGYGGIVAALLRRLHPALPVLLDTDDWEGRGGWNDRLDYPRHIKALINWLEQNLPRQVAAVSVASRTLFEQVVSYGTDPAQVVYIPNGVSVPGRQLPKRAIARALLQLDERPTVLLYTRFWEFAVEDVVAALVGMVAQCPTLRLLVIGAGEQGEDQRMLQLARRAGIDHALDLRGWADERTIAAALAGADIAIYPMDDTLLNRAKCSAKLTEQMQAGLPLVAAHVGQVAEYIDEHSGLLVRPSDSGALAQGVLRLINNPALAAQLGQAAHARVEAHFAWPLLANDLERIYQSVQVKGARNGGGDLN